jgi:hypothetical protein
MPKVIYFTVAAVPTETEAGHIATLKTYPGVELAVRNQAVAGVNSPTDNTPEEADFVLNAAGSGFVAPYDDNEDYPKITPTTPPLPTLLGTEKIIRSGVEFAGPDKSGSYVNGWTPTIAAGVVTTMLAS